MELILLFVLHIFEWSNASEVTRLRVILKLSTIDLVGCEYISICWYFFEWKLSCVWGDSGSNIHSIGWIRKSTAANYDGDRAGWGRKTPNTIKKTNHQKSLLFNLIYWHICSYLNTLASNMSDTTGKTIACKVYSFLTLRLDSLRGRRQLHGKLEENCPLRTLKSLLQKLTKFESRFFGLGYVSILSLTICKTYDRIWGTMLIC